MEKKHLNVYIGFDTRNYGQQLAYEVCRKSILKHLDKNYEVTIIPLIKSDLEFQGIFYRSEDSLASTEFTYTRFLVPYLNDYQGQAVFCDSDFLWECSVHEVFNYLGDNAVACVKHDYTPTNATKMDGLVQTVYPRKNWSSLMVFNCAHPDIARLNLENVNEKSPAWLHRMEWTKNIGEIPYQYNYLVEYYQSDDAKVYHFTEGGPWHPGKENVQYGDKWLAYLTEEEKDKMWKKTQN